MGKTFLGMLLMFSSGSVLGQTVRLMVRDTSGKALPQAEVLLVKEGVQRLTLDVKGTVHFPFSAGSSLHVSHMGYLNHTVPLDTTLSSCDTFGLVVRLLPVGKLLRAVEITRKKERLELIDGGYKVNFEANEREDLLSLIGTVPGITASSRGISVLGSSDLQVFVDGRQIHLQGDELMDYLKSLSGRNIKDISVQKIFSARHDAQNSGAILEIATRKMSTTGVTNRLSTGLTTHNKVYLGNLTTLNAKNLAVNVNLRGSHTDTYYTEIRDLKQQNTSYYQKRTSTSAPGNAVLLNANVNYNFTPKDNVYFMQMSSWYAGNSTDRLVTEQQGDPLENHVRYEKIIDRSTTALTYRRELKKPGAQFKLDYNRYYVHGETNGSNVFLGQNRHLQTLFDSKLKVQTLTADYTGILDSLRSIQAGFRWNKIVRNTSFDSQEKTLGLTFSERIAAGYVNYSRQISSLTLNVGLRAEDTRTLVTGSGERRYLDFFPSAVLGAKLSKYQRLTFNYARGIDRPKYASYTHLIDDTNPLWQTVGNPQAAVSYVHSLRLNYAIQNDKGGMLSFFGTVQAIKGGVGRILVPQESSTVFVDTLVNYKGLQVQSLEVVGSQSIGKWGTLSPSLSLRRVGFGAVPELNLTGRSILSFSGGVNFNANLKGDFTLQISCHGNTRQLSLQATNYGVGAANIYVDKYFKKARVQLYFEVLDLFDTNRSRSYMEGEMLSLNSYSKQETQMLTLGASWAFGKSKATQVKRRQAENDNRMD
jgi:hypothetical protein